jgi:hypothetical protein
MSLIFLAALACAHSLGADTKEEAPMAIVPAPPHVTIDGDLKDWNKQGRLGPIYIDEDAKDEFNGVFYAMYDHDNLYLAAEIVEPHPPFNTCPIKGLGEWNGDSIIVRMSSNPALAYPVTIPDADTNDELFTGSFWWNHLKKETYWRSYRGMRGLTRERAQMPGVETAFKPAQNGKGYTAEIKVPWKLINPQFHPKRGDRIALTWEISISNDNPAQPARILQIFANGGGASSFRSTRDWGQAVFE